MSVSMDGPDGTREQPMGGGGERLHQWLFQVGGDRALWRQTASPRSGSTPRGYESVMPRPAPW
ncbi:hypothetical protein AB0A95_04595 [Micromonospora sp. NPDC049230]|uniref:hypothetical protein n=1 Tax=Micromonospora sp. NPDC049230 TaxID=3155502 RepID=UPI0034030DEA